MSLCVKDAHCPKDNIYLKPSVPTRQTTWWALVTQLTTSQKDSPVWFQNFKSFFFFYHFSCKWTHIGRGPHQNLRACGGQRLISETIPNQSSTLFNEVGSLDQTIKPRAACCHLRDLDWGFCLQSEAIITGGLPLPPAWTTGGLPHPSGMKYRWAATPTWHSCGFWESQLQRSCLQVI